ncbi:MAG: hypothetical protein Q7S40_25995 [Opitutaceae bacterium]|nr:hypothetical protein [Opitutaceae bacterium]
MRQARCLLVLGGWVALTSTWAADSSLQGIAGGTPALPGGASLVIQTSDGLALGVTNYGRPSLQLDGRNVPLATDAVLFRVREATAGLAFAPVASNATTTSGRLVVQSVGNPYDLGVTARISSRGDFLQIDGEVIAREPIERCVDLKISLPVSPGSFVRDTGLFNGPPSNNRKSGKRAAAKDADVDVAGGDDNALYPLSPVSNHAAGVGLTLAVPPTHPTRFNTGSDGTGVYVILRIGISPAAATPNRTPFRVIAYRHDAAWGFRSALDRYYDFYREDFFTRKVKRIGAWTTQKASKLANPHLYAYHEAGFGTWRHPAGTESGINVKTTLEHLDEGPIARTLEDYERLGELALDENHGIYSLPYTIVGQRQLLQLPELPKDYDEAMRVLESWSPRENILFDGPPQAVSFRSADELKAIIRNSTLHDAQGRLAIMPRAYRGPTLTFPQNPNPNLHHDAPKPTIARYTLDYYLPLMLGSKYVDGLYLDSLGRWCGYYNFRREHFKYSTVPLTYHGHKPQVCIWNLQSHAEYMWEARRRLHAQGKILMANGVHPERVMLGFACDVMGREGSPAYTVGEEFYALRVAAGVKPYCLLNASHHVSPRLWNSCLYLGYLMGCNDPKGLPDEARYLPLIIKCNEAGWEAVTHARSAPAVVGVERWGGQGKEAPLFFTVMNRSTAPVEAEIAIDLAALRRTGAVRATALLGDLAIKTETTSRQLLVRLKLGAEEANVIQVRAAGSE